MKVTTRLISAIAAVCASTLTATAATNLVITALESSGELQFSQMEGALEYSVEWAPFPGGPWTNSWTQLNHISTNQGQTITVTVPTCYRVLALVPSPDPMPNDMVYVTGGAFQMGDTKGDGVFTNELPVHQVTVNSLYMSKYLTTKGKWDEVRSWAATNGYAFSTYTAQGWATNHPVYNVTWHDILKWCNARSQKEHRSPCFYTTAGQTAIYKTGEVDVVSTMVNWTANGFG